MVTLELWMKNISKTCIITKLKITIFKISIESIRWFQVFSYLNLTQISRAYCDGFLKDVLRIKLFFIRKEYAYNNIMH